LIPAVDQEVVEAIANGAGFGAALFLSEEGFALGEKLAEKAEQIDLDANLDFQEQFISALALEMALN
jgi:uncharacterized 2Fe-2S/4Fe-4S cluster protein (DUF4445 family)